MADEQPSVANDIFKGISGILWFFYRVFFTMIPTATFIILLYALLKFYYKHEAKNTFLKDIYISFNKGVYGDKIILTLVVIGFLNIILEAVVIKIAYRILGFSKLSADMFSEFLYDNFSRKMLIIKSPIPMFNIMNTHSLIKNSRVFEHIQYALAREFLFNNTWMLLLSSLVLIIPAYLKLQFGFLVGPMNLLMLSQFFVALACALVSMEMVKCTKGRLKDMLLSESEIYISKVKTLLSESTNAYEKERAKSIISKEDLEIHKRNSQIVIIILLVSCSLALLLPFTFNKDPLLILIGIDFGVFVICFFLISAAFREYVNVEGIVHFYYLLEKNTFFSK